MSSVYFTTVVLSVRLLNYELHLRHLTRRTMPTITKKRRMVTYDQNGRMKKDSPEASSTTAKKPKVGEKPKSAGETREARLAKMSKTVKSNFESDLERIVQDAKELKEGV